MQSKHKQTDCKHNLKIPFKKVVLPGRVKCGGMEGEIVVAHDCPPAFPRSLYKVKKQLRLTVHAVHAHEHCRGVHRTMQQVKKVFFWAGLRKKHESLRHRMCRMPAQRRG